MLLCPPGGHPIKWEEIIMANEKILVVDDDTNICELLRLYLTKEGYQVTVANDGEEGLEKFNQVKPDMVLLDVMMPKMDGSTRMQGFRCRDGKSLPMSLCICFSYRMQGSNPLQL